MVKVRRVRWEDVDDIYRLACDAEVREASFNSNGITYQEHLEWFKRILYSHNERIYVLIVDDKFYGQIRYTISQDGKSCTVGISLIEQARSNNNGITLFLRSLNSLKSEIGSVIKIYAYVKKDNSRSIKYFNRINFSYIRDTEINNCSAQELMFRIPKTFIIAELSANHNHDIVIAKKTIEAAKNCGANAIKLQTYTADTITIDCNNEFFVLKQNTIWDNQTFYNLYKEAATPWEWYDELAAVAESSGLILFSTPFDKSAVDFLETKNVPMYKIASFEITDLDLIEYTASKGKPIIISTGIATISEIQEAVNVCRMAGNNDITLLKCTSSYPAPIDDANLNTMVNMRETFGVKIGFSDHTMGNDVAIAAVALGAEVIEKHLIIDRHLGGPDASFSSEPAEFKSMVDSIRNVEKAMGQTTYALDEKSEKNREFRRSLFIIKDIRAGEEFTENNIRSIRPGYGLEPKNLKQLLGMRARIDIKRGTPMAWKLVE